MPIVGDHRIYSLGEVLNMPNTPQSIVIKHLIYEKGKTVLVGKPKFGKTWLALMLSISVARGEPILGFDTRMCPVLYLEFDRRFLTNVIHELTKEPSENWFVTKLPSIALNDRHGIVEVEKIITETKPKLVVIDHKSACFAGKESEDEPNHRWLQNLDGLAKKYDLTYLVICQAPKGWRGDTVDLPFGSRVLTAWADTILSITKSGQNYRKMEVTSNYGSIAPIVYDKNFNVVPELPIEFGKGDIATDVLKERWEECKYPNIVKVVEEVAKNTGCSYKTVWDAYKRLKEEKAREATKQPKIGAKNG